MILLAFLAGLALSIFGVIFVVVRGVGLWRQIKESGSALGTELASFERRAEETDRHLDAWERSNAELERALARLRHSRARLQILLDAVEQSQGRLRWLRVFIPAR